MLLSLNKTKSKLNNYTKIDDSGNKDQSITNICRKIKMTNFSDKNDNKKNQSVNKNLLGRIKDKFNKMF